ncbi:MAG TPA: DUF423 domain-containing protein [Fimbriimonadaceae bacterium]|nr:DUF423 domain-containing protein [Fimbriimonadaceae bacterium]
MQTQLLFGALNGFLAVALGAFGAHALKPRISEAKLALFQTGTHYHLLHAVAILVVAMMAPRIAAGFATWSARCFFWGILLFSGSLYVMAVTQMTTFAAVTPFGGVCFLAGWLILAIAAVKAHQPESTEPSA